MSISEEEYQALMKIPGYAGVSHRSVCDACDPCNTNEEALEALGALLKEHGIDIAKPINPGIYFDARIYVLHEHPEGKILGLEDFQRF